jgi:hypothetical protein
MAGGRPRDRGAGDRRAGERDVIDAGVGCQCGASLGTVAGDEIQRSAGKPTSRQFGHTCQRQAGVFGRLDDAGVAGCERRADAAAEYLQRVIPRNDVAGDAVRFAHRQHRHARLVGNRVAMQLVGGAAVVLAVAGQCAQHRPAPVRAACRWFGIRAGPARSRARVTALPASSAVGRDQSHWCGPTVRCRRRQTHAARRSQRRRCPPRCRGPSSRTPPVRRIDDIDRCIARGLDPAVADKLVAARFGQPAFTVARAHDFFLLDQQGYGSASTARDAR